MFTIVINHRTVYQYREPVEFGAHKLILRPRESRSLRIIQHELTIAPSATVTWAHDVFGNAVATAVFQEPSIELVVNNLVKLELDTEQWPVFEIAASASNYPFLISDDESVDLGGLRLQSYLDSGGRVKEWAQEFVRETPTNTLALLKDICTGVAEQVTYEARETDIAQTPCYTLDYRRGSCRDFAVLFVDAVRSLGFGARIVSGYLYDPDKNALGLSGEGNTHAWAEVYVPGAGWIVFDPTNRNVGGFNLIPVAFARHIRQVMPVSGSFIGEQDVFNGMDVSVKVSIADA